LDIGSGYRALDVQRIGGVTVMTTNKYYSRIERIELLLIAVIEAIEHQTAISGTYDSTKRKMSNAWTVTATELEQQLAEELIKEYRQ
jgi:hypothetical protein